MKIISIILDQHLSTWILGGAQKNQVTISEFVRNLLYEKMQQGPIVIHYKNKFQPSNSCAQIHCDPIKYTIFTAKLLERLILATEEQGEIFYKSALEETQTLLEQLNFNSKKIRFCISLEEMLFTWLATEATRLQLKIVPLIRRLLEDIFVENQNHELTELPQISNSQKISIKYQIMTYLLLEKLVNQTVDGAETIIQDAKTKAHDLWLKLCSTHGKAMLATANSET